MPAVSVIMAYHRVTPFLRPAVSSILSQTLGDLEVLLIDDGTGQGIEPLGPDGEDRRIRLVTHTENRGIVAAHNSAMAYAQGEFVAFMDYDDVALPHRLERQVAALRADPTLLLVGSHALGIDSDGRITRPQFTLTEPHAQMVFSAYSMPATSPTYLGRREAIARHPFRPEFPFAGEYDQFARIAEEGKVRALPEILLHYRTHAAQTTTAGYASQVLSACVTRLLTARRRAGRNEDLPPLAADLAAWLRSPPALDQIYGGFARRCLEEGFPLLAVYHARKRLSVSRTPAALAGGIRVLGQATRISPAQTGLLIRMLLTGPLRAHGLRPL